MKDRRKRQAEAPFLAGAYVVEERVQEWDAYPFNLPFVRGLDLDLSTPVTLFVGENGSGKSTLLEALAELARLPVAGGSRNELADSENMTSRLADAMRPRFLSKPPDALFFRADGLSDFARLLEQRKADPGFNGDPYALYGGKSLRERSHGQAVTFVLRSRGRGGLFLFDEPEAALSPMSQTIFVDHVSECLATGTYQFVLATHSPILMSIPGARVLDFDRPALPTIEPRDTKHWHAFASVMTDRK